MFFSSTPRSSKIALAAGELGDVLEHGLAAVAVARRLDRGALEDLAQVVDDERGEGLALDVLGDDQQRAAGLGDLLEQGHQLLHRGDLLLVDEDVGVLELGGQLVGVGDEVRADVAAVELHALDDVDLVLDALALFDGDDAVFTDLGHGVGDLLADRLFVVGADRADLGDDAEVAAHLGGLLVEVGEHRGDRRVDAGLEAERADAGGDGLEALGEDRLGEHGGGGGAVAGLGAGLRGHFAHQARAHVLERVAELDLLGDGHAVLGHLGAAPALVDHDVAAGGAEGALHRAGELLDAGADAITHLFIEHDLLGGHGDLLEWDRMEWKRGAEPRGAAVRPCTGCAKGLGSGFAGKTRVCIHGEGHGRRAYGHSDLVERDRAGPARRVRGDRSERRRRRAFSSPLRSVSASGPEWWWSWVRAWSRAPAWARAGRRPGRRRHRSARPPWSSSYSRRCGCSRSPRSRCP